MKKLCILALLVFIPLSMFSIGFAQSNNQERILKAGFEDLDLSPESYWNGNRDSLTASPDGNSFFKSGSFYFSNNYNKQYSSWSMFAYSNITDTSFVPENMAEHQFRNVVGTGANNTSTFSVICDMGDYGTPLVKIDSLVAPQGVSLDGFYVTNAAYLYDAVVNGNSFSGAPFAKGDFFRLDILGISPNGDTSRVEFFLSDFRSDDEADHYITNTWEWVDLSSLGKVKELVFHVHGSRTNEYGETLPTYFCMDELTPFDGTDVEDILKPEDMDISLYPNPATDYINIKTDLENYSIRIFDMSGIELYKRKGLSAFSQHSINFLSSGNYIVRISSKNTTVSRKVVVLP